MKLLDSLFTCRGRGFEAPGRRTCRRLRRLAAWGCRPLRAFTIVELMVAVAIMSLIIVALSAMFDQTQRALRSNNTQVDVLEAGRAAATLLQSEIAQVQPTDAAGTTNFFGRPQPGGPISLNIPGGSVPTTNRLQELFFQTRPTADQWEGIGYRVLPATNAAGQALPVGTLARFAVTVPDRTIGTNRLFRVFNGASATNFQRVLEGVINFQVTPYDANGIPLTYPYWSTNVLHQVVSGGNLLWVNTATNGLPNAFLNRDAQGGSGFAFVSNAIPASVEVQLGVMDPQVVAQLKSMPSGPTAQKFLENQAGSIRLFRFHIPIRTAPQ